MKAGDVAVCSASRGYPLTTGKAYTILKYEPAFHDESAATGFTWPPYVEVMGDNGHRQHCHAHRFTVVVE